jgi:hypothetical protein
MHIVVFFVVDLFDFLIQFVQVHFEIVEDICLNIGIVKRKKI